MKNKTLALIDGFSLGGAETQLLSIEKYNVFEELTIIALEKNTFHLENKNYENIFFYMKKNLKINFTNIYYSLFYLSNY